MIVLTENQSKIYGAIVINDPSDFVPPFSSTLFPCLIWDHHGRFTDAQRAVVAKALLESGCRYAICGGENSDAWHLAVDMEFVLLHVNDHEDVRDTVHVMTTSHAGESPDDVAFFFVRLTNFDDHEFTRFLVLHVGSSLLNEQVDEAVRRYALNKDAV